MAATTGPFLQNLRTSPHTFLQPTLPLHTDALAYLKNALDPVALDVSTTQQQRLLEARKKRKRGEVVSEDEVLRIKQLHTKGFAAEQREVESGDEDEDEDGESELGEEGVDWTYDGEDVGEEEEEEEEGSEDGSEMPDAEHDDYEDEDVEMGSEGEDAEEGFAEEPAEEFVEDKFGLNDGFFSIDDFNKQSEFMEQQDARGDDEGAASDEEDIDWDADPSTMAQGAADAGPAADGESDDEDEEEGPTFGDPDAPSEDEDEDIDGDDMDLGGMGNTNNVMYADFFAPPAQKQRKK
ncbi:hypothetical protein Q7P37_009161 [Cladosporium fusiforme]